MIRAGRLSRKIKIERSVSSESVVGAPDQTWETLRNHWANKIPMSGREILQFNRAVSGEVADWEIRYDSEILTTDRINEGGKIWDIISIREIGYREGLRITAELRQ